MEEANKIMMRERVVLNKFDHSGEEPVIVDTVTQETLTPVSEMDAMLMGWVPKDQQQEPTELSEPPISIGSSDGGGLSVGD